MSTFKVTKVEFEPPIKGEPVKPLAGWVCVGATAYGRWFCGCDTDSPADAYEMLESAADDTGEPVHPATVQMFRVEPA